MITSRRLSENCPVNPAQADCDVVRPAQHRQHRRESGAPIYRSRCAGALTVRFVLAATSCTLLSACTSDPRPQPGATSVTASSEFGQSAGAPAATTASGAGQSSTSSSSGTLRASTPRWRLAAPVSREVVLIQGSDLEVIGGLTSAGASTAAIELVDPRTGTARAAGRLAAPAHDAAGAVLRGRGYLFGGGGDTGSAATVQRLRSNDAAVRAASLPQPRSDLAAVGIAGAVYLIGGYDGAALSSSVLKSTDGTTFTTVAPMPAPVRYPALAALGDVIWVFGGQNASGPTDVIQRIDVRTGHSRIVGRLPSALSGASAVLLHGQIFLCGGTTPAGISNTIRRFDPVTGRASLMGHLPTPLSNAAAAVLDNTGYLLGGETPTTTSAIVKLQLTPPTGRTS